MYNVKSPIICHLHEQSEVMILYFKIIFRLHVHAIHISMFYIPNFLTPPPPPIKKTLCALCLLFKGDSLIMPFIVLIKNLPTNLLTTV